jgi:hypothetical protein
MIDIPEALTIARQLDLELRGKVVASGMRGNSPHKFAFYSRTAEEYAAIFPGNTVGTVTPLDDVFTRAAKPSRPPLPRGTPSTMPW